MLVEGGERSGGREYFCFRWHCCNLHYLYSFISSHYLTK